MGKSRRDKERRRRRGSISLCQSSVLRQQDGSTVALQLYPMTSLLHHTCVGVRGLV